MITDELVEAALAIASPGRDVVEGDDATWQAELPTMATMRAALEAVLPMIRAEVLEEAAKAVDARELRWLEDAEQSSSGSAERIFRRKADAAELIAFAIRAMKGASHDNG